MSDSTETPAQPAYPKRFFRRGKIQAYRDQFMLADGTIIDGERFQDITRLLDYIPVRWYDADTGEELTDHALAAELELKYKATVEKKLV